MFETLLYHLLLISGDFCGPRPRGFYSLTLRGVFHVKIVVSVLVVFRFALFVIKLSLGCLV